MYQANFKSLLSPIINFPTLPFLKMTVIPYDTPNAIVKFTATNNRGEKFVNIFMDAYNIC